MGPEKTAAALDISILYKPHHTIMRKKKNGELCKASGGSDVVSIFKVLFMES